MDQQLLVNTLQFGLFPSHCTNHTHHIMIKLLRHTAIGLAALMGLALVSCESTPNYSRPNRSSYSSAYKPQVTIRNRTNRSVLLGLRGPETRFISIPAYGSRTVNLRSGTYKYAANSSNTRTISGYKYFGTNKRYTWNFSRN